jgi:hypothetical protein
MKEARKTLGVKTAPTGDNNAQFEHMLESSQKWAAQIKASDMRQIDAWLALLSTIWKTLEYPLTCTTLTEKQCEQIMLQAMSAGLKKSHICRSFPTSLIHARSESFGAAFPHLFTVQGIAHLSTLVSHSTEGYIMGLLLRAAMEEDIKEAGCGPFPWHPEFKVVLKVITNIGQAQSRPSWQKTAFIFTTISGWIFTHRKTCSSWQNLLHKEPHHQKQQV